MKFLLLLSLAFSGIELHAQFHDDNIPKITSLQAAREYADRYREVSFGIINAELDVFLFDEVDTSNLQALGVNRTVVNPFYNAVVPANENFRVDIYMTPVNQNNGTGQNNSGNSRR